MRTELPASGTERDLLTAFLDAQRDAVLRKTEGLTREQLARRLPPSTLTLAGLLNHLALVEDSWFRKNFLGAPPDELWAGIDRETDPDQEFRTALELDPDDLRARYARACARSREVVAGTPSLDQLSARASARTGKRYDLRWVLLHLIEETARHAGHADLLREAIDGTTGG
ncbi:DinB family protein [Blastococcus tunisiensis]|uniref:DinB family protein n=1 Tax=Blastococcus tunisiensis TaxID=1798228 RepID=A0A1I2I3M7_9ACTN|nr:DinB family protein [Blastococcus sp. DSM 46838]SFF36794.1 Protein of unknown function [Blastococcus sp. DSM 46838]